MSVRIIQVDAFTNRPFSGNPAGVCVLDNEPEMEWMQLVAREMNLSETAFVTRRADGEFDLRWFTPATEVDLCGHATLASAHVLWEEDYLGRSEEVRFHTKSGMLRAWYSDEWIHLDFPALPEEASPLPDPVRKAIPADPIFTGQNGKDYLIVLSTEEAVRDVKPDFALLKEFEARGIIVTAASKESSYDFVSRFFAPAVGIDEDPVTGSAHCCLGPYWQRQLGKADLTGLQVSARGGIVKVRVEGDRVRLSGQAVTVLRAELVA